MVFSEYKKKINFLILIYVRLTFIKSTIINHKIKIIIIFLISLYLNYPLEILLMNLSMLNNLNVFSLRL
jgi:hypothetical protein